MARKPLEYLQNAFFGKISRSEWVKKSTKLFEKNSLFRINQKICLFHVKSGEKVGKKPFLDFLIKREVERGSTLLLRAISHTLPLFYLLTQILRMYARKNYATEKIHR